MNIGIVTTWFERGAAYVSKLYMECLEKEHHKVFIFARGGEEKAKNKAKWNRENVTWGSTRVDSYFKIGTLLKWIRKNDISIVFFNEQRDYRPIVQLKQRIPNLKIGSYVDYYTEKTIKWFNVYDFLICNTHRHMEAFSEHPQCYYLRWGTDIELFKPLKKEIDSVTFFHSVGMSNRKGTDILLDTFINNKLYEKSKLIIHTQVAIDKVSNYTIEDLKNIPNIIIINKTVSAPGLYYLGDVYVYPTRLDGLGLTLYEALSCGLPVITTNYPPMNEVIDNSIGFLVDVERNYCRSDGYYWPMSICKTDSLNNAMLYYINNKDILIKQKCNARLKAEKEFNWFNRSKELSSIFANSVVRNIDRSLLDEINDSYASTLTLKYRQVKRALKEIWRRK